MRSSYGDVVVGIVAERFEYYRGGKTISITVQDGRDDGWLDRLARQPSDRRLAKPDGGVA